MPTAAGVPEGAENAFRTPPWRVRGTGGPNRSQASLGTAPFRFQSWPAEPSPTQAALLAHHVGDDIRRGRCCFHALDRRGRATAGDGFYRADGTAQRYRRSPGGEQLCGVAEIAEAI